MTSFVTWLQGVLRSFTPWVTVKPWEQGVRVRFGKNVRLLPAGMYWKLPFFDSVTVLPVRVRVTQIPTQTSMTADAKAITLGMAVQYQIDDVETVFRTVHHPEQTLIYMVQGIVGEFIRTKVADAITPERIRAAVDAEIDVQSMGLGNFKVFVTDLALVRTYRIMNDGRWSSGDNVDTMGRDA